MSRWKHAVLAASAVAVTAATAVTPAAAEQSWPTEGKCSSLENPSAVVKGWCAAIIRRKGNCLACHQIVVQPWPETLPEGGNVAPPLVAMQQRYPDKEDLFRRIWDPTTVNEHSVMPPFGKHNLLTEQEIRNIIEFLHSI